MFVGNQEQFVAEGLKARLEFLLDGVDVGNGTPLAAAVVSALHVDRRISGSRTADTYTDNELMDLAYDIQATLCSAQSAMMLPYGTILETEELGKILIGGELWTLDAGRPGLHPFEIAPRGAHGPNLDLLNSHITRLTRNLGCRRLGLPKPVFVCDYDDLHLLHFKPCPEAGGVVLQFWANGTDAPLFCGALSEQIEVYAETIVEGMRAFWKHRKSIAEQGIEVREIADCVSVEKDIEVDAVILVSNPVESDELDFDVHYIGIDAAMRRGLILDHVPAWKRTQWRNGDRYPLCLTAKWNREALDELRKHGADGRITEMAASLLTSGLIDKAQMLQDLSENYYSSVELPKDGASTFITMYWQDGVICAEISKHRVLHWAENTIEFYGITIPEAKCLAMAGKPVSDLALLPFGNGIIVERAKTTDDGLRLHVRKRELLISLKTGRTWECPDSLA